jgi:signal transduction histidine kinase
VIARHNIFRIPASGGLDIFFWASTSLVILATAILSNKFGEVLSRLERFANLGRLSTELAHEIRTPLQVIQGLLHRFESAEDAKREIMAQTERIELFVKEILALGREERPRTAKLPIQDVVDHSIGLILKALPPGNEIRVQKSFCEEELWVAGDADQLVKAFSNLVRNGIDSMDGTGTLSVTIFRYGFEWLQVDIEDTGVGMERVEFDRIFEPFYTTKAGRRGIGLGLAIAKKFIEANNGRIGVDSYPGEGSRFTVRLPLSAPPKAE